MGGYFLVNRVGVYVLADTAVWGVSFVKDGFGGRFFASGDVNVTGVIGIVGVSTYAGAGVLGIVPDSALGRCVYGSGSINGAAFAGVEPKVGSNFCGRWCARTGVIGFLPNIGVFFAGDTAFDSRGLLAVTERANGVAVRAHSLAAVFVLCLTGTYVNASDSIVAMGMVFMGLITAILGRL